MKYLFAIVLMTACTRPPVRVPSPEHPDYGRCAWCAGLDGERCELPAGCDVCRR
jgi:hypothetical protein